MFKKFEIRPIVIKDNGGVEFCLTYAEAQSIAASESAIAFGLYGEEPDGPQHCYQHIADVSTKPYMLELVKNLFGIVLDWSDQDRIAFDREGTVLNKSRITCST